MEFINAKGEKKKRQPCQVFTRVMGYLRPVQQYNIGKKSEFYSRKYFTEEAAENTKMIMLSNQKFIEQYK